MRVVLLSGLVLAVTFATSSVNAADPAACSQKAQEYVARLGIMPGAQRQDYMGEIAGAEQRCKADDADAWKQIEAKLPAK